YRGVGVAQRTRSCCLNPPRSTATTFERFELLPVERANGEDSLAPFCLDGRPQVRLRGVLRRPKLLEHHVELFPPRPNGGRHYAATRRNNAGRHRGSAFAGILGRKAGGLGCNDVAGAQHGRLQRRFSGETAAQTDEVPCQFVYADDLQHHLHPSHTLSVASISSTRFSSLRLRTTWISNTRSPTLARIW